MVPLGILASPAVARATVQGMSGAGGTDTSEAKRALAELPRETASVSGSEARSASRSLCRLCRLAPASALRDVLPPVDVVQRLETIVAAQNTT